MTYWVAVFLFPTICIVGEDRINLLLITLNIAKISLDWDNDESYILKITCILKIIPMVSIYSKIFTFFSQSKNEYVFEIISKSFLSI